MSDSTATLRSPVASPFLLQDVRLIEWHLYGSASQGRVAISRPDTILCRDSSHAITRSDTTIGARRVRYRDYELKDHLGNVRVTITDMKMSNPNGSPGAAPFTADLRSYQNSYPFGMPQPGRVWNGESARYGYNGKEKDNEVNGSGNEYDYGFRVYSPRLGRFLSVDPLAPSFAPWSAFAYGMDDPMAKVDKDGLFTVAYQDADSRSFYDSAKAAASPEMQRHLESLERSDQVYRIFMNANNPVGLTGFCNYSFNNCELEIRIDSRQTMNRPGTFGDEITGAWQFEVGRLGFAPQYVGQGVYIGATLGYDMTDEMETKNAGIELTGRFNETWGTKYELSEQVSAYAEAWEAGIERVIEYFSTSRYRFHPQGNTPGASINANFGLSEARLDALCGTIWGPYACSVPHGKLNGFAYREWDERGHITSTRTHGVYPLPSPVMRFYE